MKLPNFSVLFLTFFQVSGFRKSQSSVFKTFSSHLHLEVGHSRSLPVEAIEEPVPLPVAVVGLVVLLVLEHFLVVCLHCCQCHLIDHVCLLLGGGIPVGAVEGHPVLVVL